MCVCVRARVRVDGLPGGAVRGSSSGRTGSRGSARLHRSAPPVHAGTQRHPLCVLAEGEWRAARKNGAGAAMPGGYRHRGVAAGHRPHSMMTHARRRTHLQWSAAARNGGRSGLSGGGQDGHDGQDGHARQEWQQCSGNVKHGRRTRRLSSADGPLPPPDRPPPPLPLSRWTVVSAASQFTPRPPYDRVYAM